MEPPSLGFLSCLLALFQPLSIEVIIALISAGVLLVCSALISGSEVAYFSLSLSDKELLINEKSNAASRVLKLLDRPQRLLATILIGNNFVNIAIVILSSFIVERSFNFDAYPIWFAVGFQVGVVTFLLLLLGEVIPKVYATDNSMVLCRFMSIPLGVLLKLFYP